MAESSMAIGDMLAPVEEEKMEDKLQDKPTKHKGVGEVKDTESEEEKEEEVGEEVGKVDLAIEADSGLLQPPPPPTLGGDKAALPQKRTPKKCDHGRQKSQCKDCKGEISLFASGFVVTAAFVNTHAQVARTHARTCKTT